MVVAQQTQTTDINYGTPIVIMPTYFKPLKRKIGVLTLLLACVLAGLWIRAAFVRDFINLPMQLALACDRREISLVKPQKMPSHDILLSSRYRVWNGFELIPVLTMTHTLTTVPLTLLSAYLLLSKPRQTKAPTDSQV